jgi:hypothetical protein
VSRSSKLLRAAADALENGVDPFSAGFLSEHDVTFDEVSDLADRMAIGAQVTAWAIENPRRAMRIVQAGLLGARADVINEALTKLLNQERPESDET